MSSAKAIDKVTDKATLSAILNEAASSSDTTYSVPISKIRQMFMNRHDLLLVTREVDPLYPNAHDRPYLRHTDFHATQEGWMDFMENVVNAWKNTEEYNGFYLVDEFNLAHEGAQDFIQSIPGFEDLELAADVSGSQGEGASLTGPVTINPLRLSEWKTRYLDSPDFDGMHKQLKEIVNDVSNFLQSILQPGGRISKLSRELLSSLVDEIGLGLDDDDALSDEALLQFVEGTMIKVLDEGSDFAYAHFVSNFVSYVHSGTISCDASELADAFVEEVAARLAHVDSPLRKEVASALSMMDDDELTSILNDLENTIAFCLERLCNNTSEEIMEDVRDLVRYLSDDCFYFIRDCMEETDKPEAILRAWEEADREMECSIVEVDGDDGGKVYAIEVKA